MQFVKMHGAGNDFILLTAEQLGEQDPSQVAEKMCHRRFGIGADGLMVAGPSKTGDIRMAYFNSDGSVGEMCGNGIRCFSRFVWELGLVQKREFVVETLAGLKTIWITGDGESLRVRVGMGLPQLLAQEVPALVGSDRVWKYPVEILETPMELYTIRLGVPHTVVFCQELKDSVTESIGPKVETLAIFPAKTNVNFVKVTSRNTLDVDTWERGAGHTMACGTGVCSCVYIANELGYVDNKVLVTVPGGQLSIELTEEEVYMEGEAKWVAEGTFRL